MSKVDKVERAKGELIAEGKTKRIFTFAKDPSVVVVESLNDITAGDGAKHDVMDRKAEYANQTTCNVFSFLKKWGLPMSFLKQLDKTHFLARHCKMIPLEVVVRRAALGSYLKRNPGVESGTVFESTIVEYYLKTKNNMFKDVEVPWDDPYAIVFNGSVILYDPHHPIESQAPIYAIDSLDVFEEELLEILIPEIKRITKRVFMHLEKTWKRLGFFLVDFKIEFGLTDSGNLVVADVIDNDSWRVLDPEGHHLDKQLYRDGKVDLKTVKGKYQEVAELTRSFL